VIQTTIDQDTFFEKVINVLVILSYRNCCENMI